MNKLTLQDPAKRAEWIYGQPMAPCPCCGSYNMKPKMPIKIELDGSETPKQFLGKYARAKLSGATQLEGPCYYMCGDCGHRAPAVDCAGRLSEEARRDPAVNAEMKRLWNTQGRGT